MEGGFDHADERRWPTPRLHQRFFDLQKHLENPLSDDRKRQINDELTYIAFEALQRQEADKKRQEEIEALEAAYGPFDEDPKTEPLLLPFDDDEAA